jgi:hypothetical protein
MPQLDAESRERSPFKLRGCRAISRRVAAGLTTIRIDPSGGAALIANAVGYVAKSDSAREGISSRMDLDGEYLELFDDRGSWFVGEPCLSFAHHGGNLDAGQDCLSEFYRLEAEHGSNASLDAPVILPKLIVEISTLADTNRLRGASRSVPGRRGKITDWSMWRPLIIPSHAPT